MTKNIKLNNQIAIDLPKLIDSRLLVQANSGGGKSWLLRRLLEQSHGKVQQIVIDLEGEFSTLREKFDYILAGKGGDTPADPRSAALLARRLLELNASAIIDLYELNHFDRKRFVKIFLDAMVNAPKNLWHPVMVVIDEAHVFCPEKGSAESSESVIDMATRGRKRGYCTILATQRLSKLHKDAAAECNNKLIGRTGLDVDMKRAYDELGFNTKEQYLSLRQLSEGEFFAFGPAISREVIKVKIGDVLTTHPKAGSRFEIKTAPPTAKIKALLPKLSDLPAEAEEEAKTMAELKAKIVQLKRENRTVVSGAKHDPVAIQKAVDVAIQKKEKEFYIERTKWQKQIDNFFHILEQIGKITQTALREKIENISVPRKVFATPALKNIPQIKKIIIPKLEIENDGSLSGPEQRIVDAIAWMGSIGIEYPEQAAVAFLAGYTFGGGGFNNPKGSLRSKGLVEYHGKKIALTETGKQVANVPEESLTTEELQRKVLGILPGPEQKILRALIEAYPEDLSNEETAERAGYTPGSGGFNNPKGRLRSIGLVRYPQPGRVKAKALLFIE